MTVLSIEVRLCGVVTALWPQICIGGIQCSLPQNSICCVTHKHRRFERTLRTPTKGTEATQVQRHCLSVRHHSDLAHADQRNRGQTSPSPLPKGPRPQWLSPCRPKEQRRYLTNALAYWPATKVTAYAEEIAPLWRILVDPASCHMLVSNIMSCMSQCKPH